jgi:hypothetical protein
MLPVASLRFATPPPGHTFLGVGYIPKDFLQYAALIRQASADGSPLLYNPFTTEPQAARFILLFHWLVGRAARVTGLSAIDALEWSRVPLLFLLFATLWWFLRAVFTDPKDRLAAALLVGFAGGLESLVRPFGGALLPKAFDLRLQQDTSPLHGWSAFASFYNPLWIAALCIALLVLRPLLFSAERSRRELALCALAFAVLFFVHPYTALGVLVIAASRPLIALVLREPVDWRRQLEATVALGAAGVVVGGISLWQLQDPVFRHSTGGVFGAQNLSALWYPLTLGLLGVVAVVGARRWARDRHPARAGVLGWIAGIGVLHWLPVLNGYKFVFLLPLPVCILAAPVARQWLGGLHGPGWRSRALALVTGLALFGGAALQTLDVLRSTPRVSAVPADAMELVEALSAESAGNALTPSGLGNILPAFTPHRVWVGHWFLTPDFFVREQLYQRYTTNRGAGDQLRAVLREQRIRYLVVPAGRAGFVLKQLGREVGERRRYGELELFILD